MMISDSDSTNWQAGATFVACAEVTVEPRPPAMGTVLASIETAGSGAGPATGAGAAEVVTGTAVVGAKVAPTTH